MSNNTDFSLNKNAYATFDATSLKQLIKENIYREMARDISRVMKKFKITKVREPNTRKWETGSRDLWYKYDIKRREFAYSIKPSHQHIVLYHKDADIKKTNKMLKNIARQLKNIGYEASGPSRSAKGYMSYSKKN